MVDDDCALDKACHQFYCIDPCGTGTCKSSDFCRVMTHRAICGFNEQPKPAPREETFVIGERYRPQPPSNPRMMMMMDTSNLPVIGIARRKRQHVVRRRKQKKLTQI